MLLVPNHNPQCLFAGTSLPTITRKKKVGLVQHTGTVPTEGILDIFYYKGNLKYYSFEVWPFTNNSQTIQIYCCAHSFGRLHLLRHIYVPYKFRYNT